MTARLRAVEVSAMYIRRVKVNITFKTVRKVADESALIDSGESEKFLDISVWKALGIGSIRLERPIPVHDVAGTANRRGGIICWLKSRWERKGNEHAVLPH